MAVVEVHFTGAAGAAAVDYAIVAQSALDGIDFISSAGTLTFAPGETSKAILIPILDNALPQNDRSFQVLLQNPTGGATLGSPSTAVVNILDDDGTFEFVNAQQSNSEINADNYLAVRWTGAANRAVSVDYVGESLTAKAWTDFEGVSGTLTFQPGERTKSIFFRDLEDTLAEQDEQALFRLRNPSLGARLGPQSSLIFTILDNDSPAGPGRGANWTVLGVLAQPDGKLLLSGCFNTVNGVPRGGLARWNTDGSLDTGFDSGSFGWGDSAALQPDGKIIIGGGFGQIRGVNRGNIGRLNADGSLDASFQTSIGANNWVETVAVQPDGKVLLGGRFTSVNGEDRNHIARLEANGTLDVGFVPGTGADGTVRAVASQTVSGVVKVLLGGDFTSVAGFAAAHISRLESNGSVDSSFASGTGANGIVHAILVQPDGRILIAGEFTTYNNAPRKRVARLNADGSLDNTFDAGPVATWTLLALARQPDGKILIGGGFGAYALGAPGRIARLNVNGSVDNTFQSPAAPNDDWVSSITVMPDNRIAIGGYFTALKGVRRSRVALLNPNGSLAPDGSETMPPIIRVSPVSATTNILAPPVLSVTADGAAPLSYQWRRNGITIAGATDASFSFGLFPRPVARWSFTSDELDSIGGVPMTPKNGAYRSGGALVLTGGALGVSAPLPFALREKTLEAWVSVYDRSSHNDVVGLQIPGATHDEDQFDAIVLGEMAPQRWIAGSDYWRRTQFINGSLEALVSTQAVHMAITYGRDHRITIYRNGAPYGYSYQSAGDFESPHEFPAGVSQVVFGRRAEQAGNGFLNGALDEVRIYNRALNAGEVAYSFATGPNGLPANTGSGPSLADTGNYDVIVTSAFGGATSQVARVTFLASNLVWIPPGSFTMGSPPSEPGRDPNEGPQTVTTINRPFWLGKYEVTQSEYQSLMATNPSAFLGDLSRPVEQVSWLDAQNYAARLTEQERAAGRLPAGYVYRLPTEAEWEYAARAGTTTRFSFGDDDADLGSHGWYISNSGAASHPVGQKLPNPWALQDVHGNVWEWCQDWAGAYPGGSAQNPSGPRTGTARVARGGSFSRDPSWCRSAYRLSRAPDYAVDAIGFRIALAPALFDYVSTFETPAGPEWSPRTTSVTPVGARKFLGEFGNQTVRLTLTNLPPHSAALISFDFLAIRTWDGNTTASGIGPDIFNLQVVGGSALLRTTFHTGHPGSIANGQAYPGAYPGSTYAALTGASEVRTLGYTFGGNFDAVFPLAFTFSHASNDLALNFSASGLEILANESWGLDNVHVTLLDAPAGVLEFSAPLYVVGESATTAVVTVNRIGGSLGVVSVDYSTSNGTALAGADYLATSGTLVFQDGETNKTFAVPILDDGLPETEEQFNVLLANPTGGAVLGAHSGVPVHIIDNDGFIEFTQTNVVVTEIDGYAQLTVRRTGSTNRTTSVRVRAVNGAANSNSDFFPVDFLLTFNPGQTNQTVSVAIRENTTPETDKSFTVLLSDPSSSVELGGQSAATVLILDNDTASGPGFGANDNVQALAVQPDGKIVIGGSFFAVNGVARNRIARLKADGSLDTVFAAAGTGPNNQVEALALQPDGKMILGGWFTDVAGTARGRVARLQTNGILDAAFSTPTGANNTVYEVAVQSDGKVLLAGAFTTFNGVSRNRVARLLANGSLDTTFDPGTGANATIWAMAQQSDGKVLISGEFTTFNGAARNRIARLNADGSLDNTFNIGTGLNGIANVINVLPDGKILLGGWFTTYNGVTRNRLARLQSTGVIDATFSAGTGPDRTPWALTVQPDGKILVGGDFSLINGKTLGRIARLNPSGALDATFKLSVGANNFVAGVGLLPDGRIVAAGNFTVLDGYNRARVAFLNPDGTQPADPVNWIQWAAAGGGNDHYYAFTSRPANWPGVEAEAVGYLGHLVSVNSAAEQTFIETAFLKGLNRLRPFFIGLNDVAIEGQYVWSTGEPLGFTNWAPGEPNNNGATGEDYSVMNDLYVRGVGADRFGKWNDLPLVYTLVSGNAATPHFGIMETAEVPLPPAIATQPQSQTVIAGGNAAFAVVVSSTVPVSYQWFFEGTNLLAGATGSTLSLLNVQPASAGNYGVIISNVFGSATSSPALLTVQIPPFITRHPRSLSSVTGEVATFIVEAGGTGPLAYQWRHDGTDIPLANTNYLIIENVQPASAGKYQAIVTSPFGSAPSAMATLTVLFPPAISKQPVDAAVPLGSSVTFCVEADGTPPFQFQWRINGVNLEGATNSCYAIPKVQVWHGGEYSAIVANAAGSALSATARLTITQLPNGPPAEDNFANRFQLFGASGIVSVNNRGATKEPGESDHAHKPGGSSVWYSWQAPAKGIATFRTSGSSFDTLLAIYSGRILSNLVSIASDEDRGGYLASAAQFNTQAEAFYQVAIDGYAAAQGGFILSWSFEATLQELPLILTQPQSRTVPRGAEVTLRVEASGEKLGYQWSFNGTALEGAVATSLLLTNVQRSHVGAYTVRVTNGQLRTADSEPASVEIGSEPGVQSQDKLEDLFLSPPNPLAVVKASANAAGLISVRAGTIGSHTLNNSVSTNSGQAELSTLCGLIGGERRWFNLRAEDAGVLTIDTQGSAIDTLLGVFTLGFAELVQVACDNNGAPDGLTSLVRFPSVPGTDYLIGIDGAGGRTGVIQLNWSLGAPLAVRRSSTTLFLAWPASFAGFVLQETDQLPNGANAAAWSAVALAPQLINGTNVVSLPPPQTNKFYRLRQP